MIGNPVDYDKKYQKDFPIFPAKFDWALKRYLDLVPGKEVLDLGIGQGMNSIPLSRLGYNVTGVDYSRKCLEICKDNCPSLNLIRDDIRNFLIEKDKYDLILSRCVLHFLHKDDTYKIINNIKNNLKENGLVYISVFSLNDPKLENGIHSTNFELLNNNILHNIINDTYISFFSKEEILSLFDGFKTLLISEEYFLDEPTDVPHYHGIIKYIGQKIK